MTWYSLQTYFTTVKDSHKTTPLQLSLFILITPSQPSSFASLNRYIPSCMYPSATRMKSFTITTQSIIRISPHRVHSLHNIYMNFHACLFMTTQYTLLFTKLLPNSKVTTLLNKHTYSNQLSQTLVSSLKQSLIFKCKTSRFTNLNKAYKTILAL